MNKIEHIVNNCNNASNYNGNRIIRDNLKGNGAKHNHLLNDKQYADLQHEKLFGRSA